MKDLCGGLFCYRASSQTRRLPHDILTIMERGDRLERHENPSEEEARKRLIEAIYDECRKNVDLYNSPGGIDVIIGQINWTVTYWPAWEDERGEHDEILGLTRDSRTYKHPVSYRLKLDGTATKNEGIEKRVPGGVYFDKSMEHPIGDLTEIDLLRAIVIAAHEVRK